MLTVFPLGLLDKAVAFDIVCLLRGDPEWFRIWMISAGVIGSLLADLLVWQIGPQYPPLPGTMG